METPYRDDLDVIGSVAGVFVALLGLATILGQTWQYVGGTGIMLVQLLGALASVGIGVGLVYVSHFVE